MFCVIYRFTVKPDREARFRRHWLAVTKWYYRNAGSLGSRLHRADTGEHIGYAQWPGRQVWERQSVGSDAELQAHRQAMRACCESIEVVYELETTDDLFQQDVAGGRENPICPD